LSKVNCSVSSVTQTRSVRAHSARETVSSASDKTGGDATKERVFPAQRC
jgi:hypothetical protein